MKKFDCVMFDVDSTLVTIEGVDWLAQKKGIYAQVAALTELSMNGTVPLDEVFQKKLNLLAPSRHEMALIGNAYCKTLTEDVCEVIESLQRLGKEVWLVSGGFEPAIEILAEKIGIPMAKVKANSAFFKECGCFQAIDLHNPLTKQRGKADIVRSIGEGKKSVFIGDSVTDLATKPYVNLFIGYGGVAKREKVHTEAEVYITRRSLAAILPYIVTKEEFESLKTKQYARLMKKAVLYN